MDTSRDQSDPAGLPAANADAPNETGPTTSPAAPANEEGLPEWEPLTPELVEDEALRGDFMLRWAAVLLAVLLGCTEISDSQTLVRIRTGEHLASHGLLPPRVDVFSYTATDRPWINLSWLSDLLLGAVHSLGGDSVLTVLAALLAGATVWLVVNSGRSGVSTWWNSVCAVLAVLAAFPLLRPGPEVITVLGLAATMYVLARTEDRPEGRAIWALPPLLWLWANLDAHAFLGAAIAAAYAVGRTIGGDDEGAAAPVRRLWIAVGLSLLVMLVHPFHWHVFESPWTVHSLVYPQLEEYAGADTEFRWLWLPLTNRSFWDYMDVFNVAGMLISVAALLAMVLNRNQLRWSHVLVWLTVNGLAVAAGRQLSAVAVVNAVLAGVNGQDWFRASFRQTYSVETGELMFSRGGRALTVLALFVLSYLAISGRLMGADGRRIGLGFDHALTSTIDSYRSVLEDSFDDRPFNFVPEQGDLLIWLGQRPFIDSRVDLYARGTPDLAELHRELRPALRPATETDLRTGNADLWRETFDTYEVTHVLPRLSGNNPDYISFFGLMLDPERRWALARLGAATASLYRTDTNDRQLAEYLADHPGADFIRRAFPTGKDSEVEVGESISVLPREWTWYDRFLMLPRQETPADVQLARHYNTIRVRLGTRINLDYQVALTMLTIRHARQGLNEEPNSAGAWQALAASYYALTEIEGVLQRELNSRTPTDLRVRQLISALYHALTCDPDDAGTHMTLFEVLLRTNKPDLALYHLREFERMTGGLSSFETGSELGEQQSERNREIMSELTTLLDSAREELNAALLAGTERLQVVQDALNRQMPGEALRILEEDQTVVAQNVPVQMLQAELLLDAGRIEEGLTILERLSEMMRQPSAGSLGPAWRQNTALANIAAGNGERARELWGDDARAATRARLQSLLGFSPLVGEVPGLSSVPLTHAPRDISDARPLTRAAVMGDVLLAYPPQWTLDQLCRALVLLDTGENEPATELLQQILDFDPESQYRPLIAFYLSTITGERVELAPPSEEIPIWEGMFAPDEESGPDDAGPQIETEPSQADDAPSRFPPPPPGSLRSRADR